MLDGMPPLTAFATEFARLNRRQREAVEHPDGPVLVVAGPGTGKTQLLAARVAWLLKQPDVRPQEILCLTYTEPAARNMRERLLRFIGPDAHRVAIHTFHSFGQLIIQENADKLGYHELTVASDLELDQLLRELIDTLPEGHQLRRDTGDRYYEVGRLAPLFATMKKEGWNQTELRRRLEEYRVSLPKDPDYLYKVAVKAKGAKKGDVNQTKLAEEEYRLALTEAAAALFAPYQEAMLACQRYTYDDMLGWATKLLTEHEGLRQAYQERFQHFLVDEYQDTNGAQSELLHLLAGYWENPSVLAVGDDDQSIYRFQGASVANVLAFKQRYPMAHVVVLEENYRSSAAVLAAAEALIDHNKERLTEQLPNITKKLQARHPRFADSAVLPELRSYESPVHEAAHLAAEIGELYRRGWPNGGGAVLAHNHNQLDLLAKLLAAAGVPFHRTRKVNVLTTEPLATGLYRALAYVAAALQPEPSLAEAPLFAVLHLEALAVPPVELVRLAVGYRARYGYSAHPANGMATTAVAPTWRSWAEQVARDEELAAELGLSVPGREALLRALARLDSWVQAGASRPLPALLELICLDTLVPAHLVAHAHPDHLLAVASVLLQFGRDEAHRQANLGVAAFLDVWDRLAETKNGLPLEQTTGADKAQLQLLTTHAAKGLEFERVWVLGCQRSKWLKSQRNEGYRLPPALREVVGERAAEEESRRLFFVAMTRAQEHLVLSFSRTDSQGKDSAECLFITELETSGGLVVRACEVPEVIVDEARREQLAPAPAPAPVPSAAVLDDLLADFALSATTLNAYLECPISCYYEHLLKVPSPRAEPLLFGSAVHDALEHLFRQCQQHPERVFGSAEVLASAFAQRYARHRHELAPADFQRGLYAGQALLRAYHAHWHPTWLPTAIVEHNVSRALVPGGVVLRGKVDRLDPRLDGAGHDVVDYKTGKPDSTYAKANLAPALHTPGATLADWHREQKLRGGNYWRQGVFYHLLLTHDTEARFRPASVSFCYVQAQEKPGQRPTFERKKVTVTPDDEVTVLAQIQAVDAAIRAHQFDHGCGECAWCQLRAA